MTNETLCIRELIRLNKKKIEENSFFLLLLLFFVQNYNINYYNDYFKFIIIKIIAINNFYLLQYYLDFVGLLLLLKMVYK